MLGLDENSIAQEIAHGRALLLLDGLDELPEELHIPDKERTIRPRETFIASVQDCDPTNRVVLTSRMSDGARIENKGPLTCIQLLPLDDAQIADYLRENPPLAKIVETDAELRNMARTPLLLSIIKFAYLRDAARIAELSVLSDSPYELRDRLFTTYIERRFEHESLRSRARLRFSLDEFREVLGEAALNSFDMSALFWRRYRETEGGNEFVDAKPIGASVRATLGERADVFIKDATHLNFLLQADGADNFRFLHELLRDYFGQSYALTDIQRSTPRYLLRDAFVLGRLGNAAAGETLIGLLNAGNSQVRATAAWALGMLRYDSAAPRLVPLLLDHANYWAGRPRTPNRHSINTISTIVPSAMRLRPHWSELVSELSIR